MLIRTIYRKELLDILRDRRTLIAMVAVPVVLYPLLIVGILQLTHLQEKRQDAEQVEIGVPDVETRDWLADIVAAIHKDRDDRIARQRAEGTPVKDEPLELGDILPVIVDNVRQAVDDRTVHAALDVIRLAAPRDPRLRTFQIVVDDTSDRSRSAAARIARILNEYKTIQFREAFDRFPVPGLAPFDVLAAEPQPEAEARWMLAKIVPVILILMTLTGAIYPAIDLTAGERERGTLETLMVCPVPIFSLIAGKFLVVVTVAMLSATLNLASMGATLNLVAGEVFRERQAETGALQLERPAGDPTTSPGAGEQNGLTTLGSVWLFAKILLLMIPFAVFSSALLMAVCSFARTFKEAQNYVAPVILTSMIPCFLAALPGTQLSGLLLVLPVGNMVLLTREMLLGHVEAGAVAIVLLSTSVYAAAAIALAARLFGHEAVVFSDSLSWRSMLDRRVMRPTPEPSPTQLLVVTAFLFPAIFYIQSAANRFSGDEPARQLALVGATLLLVFGLIPLAVTAYCKIDVARTFRLRAAAPRFWIAAVLIGASGWVLAHEIVVVQNQVLPMPPELVAELEKRSQALMAAPAALVLLVLAIVPGICEELFFRGFMLSSLAPFVRRSGAILVAAVVFAVFHMDMWRFPVTATLGVLLGILCWQSGSVLPALLAHAMHNAAAVSRALFPKLNELLRADGDGHLSAQHLVAAALAIAVALWLVRTRPARVPRDPSVASPPDLPAPEPGEPTTDV